MSLNLKGHHLGQLNAGLYAGLQSDINFSRCTRSDFSWRRSRGGAAAARNDLGDLDGLVKNIGDLDLAGLGNFSRHLAKVQDLWLKLDGLTRVHWRGDCRRCRDEWGLVGRRVDERWRRLRLCIKVLNPIGIGLRARAVALRLGGRWSSVAGRRGLRCWRRRLLSGKERNHWQDCEASDGGTELESVSHKDSVPQNQGVDGRAVQSSSNP